MRRRYPTSITTSATSRFKEDSSKIRTGGAPQVLATIRNIGIFVLELAGHKNKAAGLRDLASHTFNLRALDLLGL
jgi:hypothetical protein